MRSDPNMNTLLSFRYKRRFVAESGSNGTGRLRHGKKGPNVEVRVPVGTVVRLNDGVDNHIADLSSEAQSVMVARGGSGGRGNSRFAKSTNQFPLFAEKGELGEKVTLRLELRLLADVGIIGAPNAGKSTLLAAVTAAKPKIANYPFTTLEPSLGVTEHKDHSFVMVDIPGLIEGAHEGIGLGHDFLRHIQRTRVLVHLVDGALDDVIGTYSAIRHELEMHDRELASKPEVIAINKVDIPGVKEDTATVIAKLGEDGQRVHLVSAVARQGLDSLMDDVVAYLAAERSEAEGRLPPAAIEDYPVLKPRPVDSEIQVRKRGPKFVVRSDEAARIADTVDAANWEAQVQLYGQLKRMGVTAALEKAGIKPGQTFRVGSLELEWQ